MIIVTGGAGFIGSNIVKKLNVLGFKDILVVDDLQDGTKFKNLADCEILDYCDKDIFLKQVENNTKAIRNVEVVFHEGACAVTTEWNGKYMLQNNFEYTKLLFQHCVANKIPFIYASSAAVYGNSLNFREIVANERPINVYAYSKLLFEQYVRNFLPKIETQVVGLRYFNVYGPREQHKGSMASVAFHFYNQVLKDGIIRLFAGTDGYADGEQRRDFVYVDDIVNVNLWIWKNPNVTGTFNVGTGSASSFNDVANAVIKWYGKGKIQYIPFPDHLRGSYQSFTEADINKLRTTGYTEPFKSVTQGVDEYLTTITNKAVA